MIPIDTPRLRLSPLSGCDEADAALYCRIYCDHVLMRYVSEPLSTADAARSFTLACRQNATGAGSEWWVAATRDACVRIGLLGKVRRDCHVELGVMLLPSWQGKGYAFEAIVGLVERSFAQDAEVVRMSHSADNAAMAALMRKLRFECQAAVGQLRWEIGRERWFALRVGHARDFANGDSAR